MLFAIEGRLAPAVLCILLAGVIDMYDGVLARRLARSEPVAEVGRHLDSLADMCSFGLAPIVLGYCAGLRHPALVALLVLYGLACAARLAYFDATGMRLEAGVQYFTGLPVTYAALIIPITFVSWSVLPPRFELPALAVVFGCMAVLMISAARIRKPRVVGRAILSLVAVGLTTVLVAGMV
jgi:CDP-diacylglycerol--serine O-phosphatidyltransferase